MYSKNSWVWGERPSQPGAPWIVLPAGLDRVVGEVHFVVAGHVLAEDEGELVGELLRVGSADAEHSDSEVLGADRPFRKFLVAHGPDAFWSVCCSWCSSGAGGVLQPSDRSALAVTRGVVSRRRAGAARASRRRRSGRVRVAVGTPPRV